MRRRALSLMVVAAAPACTLFTDLGGLSGGKDGDGDGDAAHASEASVGAPDAAREADPITDARPDGDGSVGGCAAKTDAAFCADFDGTDPLGKFTRVAPGVAVTQSVFVSAPSSAELRIATPTPCAFVVVEKEFAGTYASGRAELALHADTPGSFVTISMRPSGAVSYNLIAAFTSPTHVSLRAQKFVAPSTPTEYGSAEADVAAGTIGAWTNVTIAFETSPARVARLRVGATEVALPLPAEFAFDTPRFVVGTWCEDSAAQMEIDDLALYVTP